MGCVERPGAARNTAIDDRSNCYCVRTRGIAALEEPNIKERLASCDEAAMKQIRERIEKMRQRGLLP